MKRAEEYYSRALLAEPGEGEVLSKYAKVIWELHGDRGRAGGYFEQAVQAAPQNRYGAEIPIIGSDRISRSLSRARTHSFSLRILYACMSISLYVYKIGTCRSRYLYII